MGSSKRVTVGFWYHMDILAVLCHAGPDDSLELVEIEIGERQAWLGSVTQSDTILIDKPDLFGGEEREGGVQGNVDVMMGEPDMSVNKYLVSSCQAAGITGPIPAYRRVMSLFFRGGTVLPGLDPSPEFSIIRGKKPFKIFGVTQYMDFIPPAFRWSAINPYFKKFRARVRRHWTGWYPAKAKIGNYMNPAHIIYECATNSEWGMGYPLSEFDDTRMKAVADVLYDEGFGLGITWYTEMKIEEFMGHIMQHINAVLNEDRVTGELFLKLIRNDYDPSTLIELNPSNCNLIEYKRPGVGEVVNEVTVKYRTAQGKWDAVTVQDLAGIVNQGQIINQTIEMPGIRTAELALIVAQRELESRAKPLSKITIEADRIAYSLYNGDVFKFSWPAEGVTSAIFRVLEMGLGTLDNNKIRIDAVLDVFGMPSASYAAPQPSGWVNPSQAPVAVTIQSPREATYLEVIQGIDEANRQFLGPDFGYGILLAARPQADSARYELNASNNNVDYADVESAGWTPTALLSAPVGRLTTTLPITGAMDFFKLVPGLIGYLGNEIVQIDPTEDFSNESQIKVKRGCVDTVPAEHPAGTRLWFYDEALMGFDPTERTQGETVYYKALTVSSRGKLPIADATATSLVFNNRYARPYPPGNLRINGVASPATFSGQPTVTWSHRDRLQQADQIIDTTAGNVGPEPGVTYTLRIYGEDGTTLLRTETGLSGTSYTYSEADELGDSELPGTGTSGYPNAVQASGPTAYWRMDEPSGTTMTDSSGNGYNGVYSNVTLGVAGPMPGTTAAQFNGTSSYAQVPDNAALRPGSGEYCIEMWLRFTSGSLGMAFGKFITAAPYTGPTFFVNYFDDTQTTGRVQFRDKATAGFRVNSNATGLNDGQWRHYVCQRRKVSTGPDVWHLELYINGTLDNFTVLSSVEDLSATGVIHVGSRSDQQRINGASDEVAYYVGKALTPTEVADHYNARLGAYRLNNSLRFELESVRDGLTSHQYHNIEVERV